MSMRKYQKVEAFQVASDDEEKKIKSKLAKIGKTSASQLDDGRAK